MPKTETMTLSEKLDIAVKAVELSDAGDEEGYSRLMRTIPLAPHLAKVAKELEGADFLVQGGWNLSEAEAEFGADWLAS